MGSVSYSVHCPRCGCVTVGENWYHSNSYWFMCDMCGLTMQKMVYFEAGLDKNSPELDSDGYRRRMSGGFGVVITDKHTHKKDVNGKCDEPVKDDETVWYETWCENDKPIKIKFSKEGFDCASLRGNVLVRSKDDWFSRTKEGMGYVQGPNQTLYAIDNPPGHLASDNPDFKFNACNNSDVFIEMMTGFKLEIITKMDVDFSEVTHYYGIRSKKSGEIACVPSLDGAKLYFLKFVHDRVDTSSDFDKVDDYDIVEIQDDKIVRTWVWSFMDNEADESL